MDPAAARHKSVQQSILELDNRKHWRTSIIRWSASSQRELRCYPVITPVNTMAMRASVGKAGENTLTIGFDKRGHAHDRRASLVHYWTIAQIHCGHVGRRGRIVNYVGSSEGGKDARIVFSWTEDSRHRN